MIATIFIFRIRGDGNKKSTQNLSRMDVKHAPRCNLLPAREQSNPNVYRQSVIPNKKANNVASTQKSDWII